MREKIEKKNRQNRREERQKRATYLVTIGFLKCSRQIKQANGSSSSLSLLLISYCFMSVEIQIAVICNYISRIKGFTPPLHGCTLLEFCHFACHSIGYKYIAPSLKISESQVTNPLVVFQKKSLIT